MDKSEQQDLENKLSELRDKKLFLWRAKTEHLNLLDDGLAKKWTDKTESNVMFHAKQISLAFESLREIQDQIQHLVTRLNKIHK